MLSPKDFKVNEAWILLKIIAKNGETDVFVLMDAESRYQIMNIFWTSGTYPPISIINETFMRGWSKSEIWPERLILAQEIYKDNPFKEAALMKGIRTEQVPINELDDFVAPLIEEINSHIDFLNR